MSNVQEIERALSQLSEEDFRKVEVWIASNKKMARNPEPTEYGVNEYGLTADDLQAFDKRISSEIEQDRASSQLRKFTGNLKKDLAG